MIFIDFDLLRNLCCRIFFLFTFIRGYYDTCYSLTSCILRCAKIAVTLLADVLKYFLPLFLMLFLCFFIIFIWTYVTSVLCGTLVWIICDGMFDVKRYKTFRDTVAIKRCQNPFQTRRASLLDFWSHSLELYNDNLPKLRFSSNNWNLIVLNSGFWSLTFLLNLAVCCSTVFFIVIAFFKKNFPH